MPQVKPLVLPFHRLIQRPQTPEQKIDLTLQRIPRPLRGLSIEELRYIVDELNEEMRLVCPPRRKL